MRLSSGLAILLLAGCSGSSEETAVREQIRTSIRSYHELLSKGDVEGAAALAASDVTIVVGGENPVHGKEACLGAWKAFVEIYKEKDLLGKRDARYSDIRIDIRGSMAIATYGVTFLEPRGPFNEAYTQLFERSGSRWLLLHEHRAPRPAK